MRVTNGSKADGTLPLIFMALGHAALELWVAPPYSPRGDNPWVEPAPGQLACEYIPTLGMYSTVECHGRLKLLTRWLDGQERNSSTLAGTAIACLCSRDPARVASQSQIKLL